MTRRDPRDPRDPLADAVAGYWDAASDAFDDEPDHGLRDPAAREAWARRLRAWVPDAPCDVLDLGCGTGSLGLLLAADGHRVTGVDLAPRMVARAREKFAAAGLGGRFVIGDAAAPPTGDERFDVVLVRHMVWTLPEPEQAIRAWVARLRPGGRLVLVEGLWREAGDDAVPYVPGAERLPWGGGGVRARQLAAAVRSLVADVHIEPLSDDPNLWGGPVRDERYALLART
ncbi:class I SAM-dependent methyltransferase [Streptomyces sp. TRM64462]|uniref:class I SAM-dependent methyltransferase n=1 Tax=Streptomyces sp. TRM64462 TaxID=2741726 RepID=UPI001586958D|nr:class I SAM-dependent methyltransferase [Streptomyces sp. TRM64462]